MKVLGAFIAGVATYWAFSKKWRTLETAVKPIFVESAKHPQRLDQAWDEIDETGWESFPASDPPGRY